MTERDNEGTALQEVDQQVGRSKALGAFDSKEGFESAQRMAMALAKSSLVPPDYRENVSNCLIATEMAQRTGCGIMPVMQNLHIIHGKPSWSSQFIIAVLNSCGRFSPLRFSVQRIEEGADAGKPVSCVAWARDKETGEVLEGVPVTMQMAAQEGWMQKKGSKWQTMPELMLRYRAAAFFGRLHAPELLMGMHSEDEIKDIKASDGPAGGEFSGRNVQTGSRVDAINDRVRGQQSAPDPAPTHQPRAGETIDGDSQPVPGIDDAPPQNDNDQVI